MQYEVTGVRLNTNGVISHLRISSFGIVTKDFAIQLVESGNTLYTRGYLGQTVPVKIVHRLFEKHLESIPNGSFSDNLLGLPPV